MRTDIVLNEKLVKEAFSYTNVSTKRELIELALKEFVFNHRPKDLRELPGTVEIDASYNL